MEKFWFNFTDMGKAKRNSEDKNYKISMKKKPIMIFMTRITSHQKYLLKVFACFLMTFRNENLPSAFSFKISKFRY